MSVTELRHERLRHLLPERGHSTERRILRQCRIAERTFSTRNEAMMYAVNPVEVELVVVPQFGVETIVGNDNFDYSLEPQRP